MFNDEENERESSDAVKKTPVYIKASEILILANHITAIVSKEDIEGIGDVEGDMLEQYAAWIMENAMIIPAKIAGAYAVELYDIKMENAAIIRKVAREIRTYCFGLEDCGFPDVEYLELLKNEIEAFRVLFAEWVKSFDPWNYIIDRWGLFNPPGVNYDDIDPDDDIPFRPDDFFDDV